MIFLALALNGTGIAALCYNWRRPEPGRWRNLLAWLLLLAALPVWTLARGVEFGTTYALLVPTLAAWLLLAWSREKRNGPPAEDEPLQRSAYLTAESAVRHGGLFIMAVPLAGATATLGSAALVKGLPGIPANNMALMTLLMPLLWGLAAFWACADRQPLRPLAGLCGCVLLSATLIYRP